MIKYFCAANELCVYSLDKDSEDIKRIDNFYADYMYYIPEDGELTYTKTDGSKVKRSVTKGTLILKMYPISRDADKELIFVENDELKDYYNRLLEKRKEEMEEKAAGNPCNSCCDCGCNCK